MSCNNILPKYSGTPNSAVGGGTDKTITEPGGETTWVPNDDFYYDRNKNGFLGCNSGTAENCVKDTAKNNGTEITLTNSVFKNLNKIKNDADKATFKKLDDAIQLASCGKWCDTDCSICSEPWNGGTPTGCTQKDKYINTSQPSPNPALSVDSSIDDFISSTSTDLSCDSSAVDPHKNAKNGIKYLITRYITDKTKFYDDSVADVDTSHEGSLKSFFKTMLTGGLPLKFFYFVCFILTVYLLLRGISSVGRTHPIDFSKIGNKDNVSFFYRFFGNTIPTKISFIFFLVIWIVIALGTGIATFSNKSATSNMYNLISHGSVGVDANLGLDSACKTHGGLDRYHGFIKIILTLVSLLIIFVLFAADNVLEGKLSSGGNAGGILFYIGRMILLVGFATYLTWLSTPANVFQPEDKNSFNISYEPDCNSGEIKGTAYYNKYNYSSPNIGFWITTLAIICIMYVANMVGDIISDGNNDSPLKKLCEIAAPFIKLGPYFVISLNIILLIAVPYYFIAYPIMIMLQRLIFGSFVVPFVMKQFRTDDNKESQSVLFEVLAGWDLIFWPLFKTCSIVRKIYGSGNIGKIIGEDPTANINVFGNFEDVLNISWIYKIFKIIYPFYSIGLAKNWVGQNRLRGGGLAILIIVVAAIFVWLCISIYTGTVTWIGNSKYTVLQWLWGVWFGISLLICFLNFFFGTMESWVPKNYDFNTPKSNTKNNEA